MNLFNQYLPGGYGIAIIILTLLIRILSGRSLTRALKA